MSKSRAMIAILAAVLFVPSLAHAGKPAKSDKTSRTTQDTVTKIATYKGGYSYTFTDDPLSAGGYDSSLAVIRVRSNLRGGLLIRPRLHFIAELVKSMESL